MISPKNFRWYHYKDPYRPRSEYMMWSIMIVTSGTANDTGHTDCAMKLDSDLSFLLQCIPGSKVIDNEKCSSVQINFSSSGITKTTFRSPFRSPCRYFSGLWWKKKFMQDAMQHQCNGWSFGSMSSTLQCNVLVITHYSERAGFFSLQVFMSLNRSSSWPNRSYSWSV